MRKLLPLAVALFTVSPAGAGGGEDRLVGYSSDGQPVYRVEVKLDDFTKGFETQKKTEWCWAACVSSVLKFYGHPVSQQRLVSEMYGKDLNLPIFTHKQLARLFNRTWTDDKGARFKATVTAVYDSRAHANNSADPSMLEQLRQGRPLIHSNFRHCMVATGVDYTADGVIGVLAFDPWPGAVQKRRLTGNEIKMIESGGDVAFVAAIEVKDVA